MSHTLADSQDFTFTSLAAAAAQGRRGPGATQDPICLCKQEKLVFYFVQVAQKGFNIQMRIQLYPFTGSDDQVFIFQLAGLEF